jgi:hypothetical protein
MIATAPGFVGSQSQLPLVETVDIVWVNGALLPFCTLGLCSGGSIHSCDLAKDVLVETKDVCLGSADRWDNPGRPIRGITGKGFSDEPAAAKRPKKAAAPGSQ